MTFFPTCASRLPLTKRLAPNARRWMELLNEFPTRGGGNTFHHAMMGVAVMSASIDVSR